MSELPAAPEEVASPTQQVTIYALTDPNSGEVRYIGRTRDVLQGFRSHTQETLGSAGQYAWIQDLRQQQKVPKLKVLEENVSFMESSARERWWIDYYHRQGAVLVSLGVQGKQSHQRRSYLQQTHPLRQWRERAGKSQPEVAEACGVTPAMVSLTALGLRIPQGALDRLIAYTGLPTEPFVRTEHFLEEQPDFLQKSVRHRKK